MANEVILVETCKPEPIKRGFDKLSKAVEWFLSDSNKNPNKEKDLKKALKSSLKKDDGTMYYKVRVYVQSKKSMIEGISFNELPLNKRLVVNCSFNSWTSEAGKITENILIEGYVNTLSESEIAAKEKLLENTETLESIEETL